MTQAARGLLALGVQPGDRVGVWSPNRYEWVVVQYATARVGAILVNVNPAYQAAELEYALRQSGVGVLFHARGFRQLVYGPMLDAARPRCPALRASSASTRIGRRSWRRGKSSPGRTCYSGKRRCTSTIPLTSNTPPGRPDSPKAPR